jgi:outer membrane protein
MKVRRALFFFICLVLLAAASLAKDLSLNESIEIALAMNPSVVSARENAQAADARQRQAFAGFLPTVSLNASLGQSYQQPTIIRLPEALGGETFTAGPNEAGNMFSYGATLTQTIFKGGKVIQDYSIANITYRIMLEELRRVKNETALDVTSSYFEVLKAKKNLELIKTSTLNLNRNLQQAEVFFGAGITSSLDLLRIKTELANLEINRIQAENGLKLARLAFENLLGERLYPETEIEVPTLAPVRPLPFSEEEALKLAFENRPEWKAYNLGLETASKGIAVAYGSLLPSVSYVLSWSRNQADYPTASTYDSNLENWRSMFMASWNIFDGFSSINKINEANASYRSAQAQAQSISDGISVEVKSAYLNLLSAADQITASQNAADLAEKALKIAEVNFKGNIISEQVYLDAHAANQSAQANLWFARYDYEIAKAALNKVIGKAVI